VAMIEVEGLSKAFGARRALDGVSFSAEKGEVLGFLGPNGAGKTTTLRILASLTSPSAGSARIAGFDTMRDSLAVRARVGYFPERAPLYDEMRVGAFLAFAATMKGLAGSASRGAVARAVGETGLAGVERETIGRLSRGYRQRVALAQALLADPPVLLLDEPTAGLDPAQIAEFRALIVRLGADRTILLSTHILPEVSATCGRVVILARGRVVAVDTPASLAARVGRGRRVEVSVDGDGNRAREVLGRVAGALDVRPLGAGRFVVATAGDRDLRAEIARALVATGLALVELRGADFSLEEVFLDLVTEDAPDDAPEAREPA